MQLFLFGLYDLLPHQALEKTASEVTPLKEGRLTKGL